MLGKSKGHKLFNYCPENYRYVIKNKIFCFGSNIELGRLKGFFKFYDP